MPCPAAAGFAGRATLTVASVDFLGTNLTVANDACGYDAGHAAQSEALSLAADRAAFTRCRFLGGQDTLYTGGGPLRSYFYDSFINGSCDSIYGDSSSVFEQCTVTIVDHSACHAAALRTKQHAELLISFSIWVEHWRPPPPPPPLVHHPSASSYGRRR